MKWRKSMHILTNLNYLYLQMKFNQESPVLQWLSGHVNIKADKYYEPVAVFAMVLRAALEDGHRDMGNTEMIVLDTNTAQCALGEKALYIPFLM